MCSHHHALLVKLVLFRLSVEFYKVPTTATVELSPIARSLFCPMELWTVTIKMLFLCIKYLTRGHQPLSAFWWMASSRNASRTNLQFSIFLLILNNKQRCFHRIPFLTSAEIKRPQEHCTSLGFCTTQVCPRALLLPEPGHCHHPGQVTAPPPMPPQPQIGKPHAQGVPCKPVNHLERPVTQARSMVEWPLRVWETEWDVELRAHFFSLFPCMDYLQTLKMSYETKQLAVLVRTLWSAK